MAHESPNLWTTKSPAVLLGIQLAVKETLGGSATEMIYGTTLRLPGDFTENYTIDANADLASYSDYGYGCPCRVSDSAPRASHIKETCSNIRN